MHAPFTPEIVGAKLHLDSLVLHWAFVGLYWLLTQTTVGTVSILAFVTPIFGMLVGWLVVVELPDQNMWTGTVLILAEV